MVKEEKSDNKKMKYIKSGGGGNAVYGLGLLGALIYFLQHAQGLTGVLLAILKSLLWPAFLIFRLLEFLKM